MIRTNFILGICISFCSCASSYQGSSNSPTTTEYFKRNIDEPMTQRKLVNIEKDDFEESMTYTMIPTIVILRQWYEGRSYYDKVGSTISVNFKVLEIKGSVAYYAVVNYVGSSWMFVNNLAIKADTTML